MEKKQKEISWQKKCHMSFPISVDRGIFAIFNCLLIEKKWVEPENFGFVPFKLRFKNGKNPF